MNVFDITASEFWATVFNMSWYEIGMLVCFGASWPFSISKMITTGRTEGKSLAFLFLVMFGYLFGIVHKLFFNMDVVIILYVFLLLVVLADAMLCIHLRRKARQNENK